MICKHKFIRISDVTKLPKDHIPGATAARGIPGVEAGCITCGQIRRVYSDGVVTIANEGGTPIDEDELYRGKGELRFNIPSDPESKRRLLIDLEDNIGVILREEKGRFVVTPYVEPRRT